MQASSQEKLKIHGATIHKIDIKESSIGLPFADISKIDLKNYLTNIIKDILNSRKSQKFKLDNELSRVPSLLELLLTDQFISTSTLVAKKLHRVEVSAQERYKGITELREGSLLCSNIEINNQQFILIVKIDHAGFLDETEFKKIVGLPEKQRAQKAATIEMTNGSLDDIVIISDSGSKITEYWWKDFLELLPLTSPEKNTEKAFKALENLLIKRLKDKSACDYWTLRNAVVSHFNTRAECLFDEMIDQIFNDYEPDSDLVEIEKIKAEAKKLPKEKDFDSHFIIVKTVIKARIKKQIRLAENLELQIKGEIEDFRDTFDTGEDDNGKFLKIYSKEGYRTFHKTGSKSK